MLKKSDLTDDFPEVGKLYKNKGTLKVYFDNDSSLSYDGLTYTKNVKVCNHVFIILGACLDYGEIKLLNVTENKIMWYAMESFDRSRPLSIVDVVVFIRENFNCLSE